MNKKNNKKMLEADLQEVYRRQLSLSGKFSLRSGKVFTYTVNRYRDGKTIIGIECVHSEGESADNFGYLSILPCGTVRHFSFFSFSGENETELNEARIYIQDCTELLSREFIEKVTADYNAKAEEFEALIDQEKVLRDLIVKTAREGGTE